MGLDPWQLAFVTAAAVALLIGVNRFGPLGLLYAAPIYLGFGVTALTSIHGVSTPKMAGLWLMKQVRHATGATKDIYRPERTQLAGTLNLPGTRASIQLWDVDAGRECVQPARPVRVGDRRAGGAGVPDARHRRTVRPRRAVRPGPRPVHATPGHQARHPAGAHPADHDPRRARALRHRPTGTAPGCRLPRRPQLSTT